MSTFDKLMVFLGAGCTALTGTALAAQGSIPKWLSLVSLFVGSGALAITRLSPNAVAPRPGTNAQ
jgi:formate-dependent nitrite reductase membrane component NrfD